MNLSIPFPGDDASKKAKKAGATSPADALHAAQRKHRRAEREAIHKAILAYCNDPKPAAVELARIKNRWDSSICNQPHQGCWSSLWPLLNCARNVPGLTAKGLVVFGGWYGIPPEDLSKATPPPEDLLGLINLYGCYRQTLDLFEHRKDSSTVEQYTTRDAALKNWVQNHPKEFGAYASPDYAKNIDCVETVAKDFLKEFLPIITSEFLRLENRTFLFFPEEGDPASGWRDFHAFADNYSRLPSDFLNGFGEYFFIVQMPTG